MGYPGEPQQYLRARNRLAAYNLAHPPPSGANIGETVGGGIGGLMRSKPAPQAHSQAPTHDPAMYKKYVEATGAHAGMAQHAVDEVSSRAVLEKADQQVANNQLAENVRLGGVFTPVGFDKAVSEADANGQDRLKLRSILGLAATRVTPPSQVMMGPGMGPGRY